jgi:hypothetical protein
LDAESFNANHYASTERQLTLAIACHDLGQWNWKNI